MGMGLAGTNLGMRLSYSGNEADASLGMGLVLVCFQLTCSALQG